MSEPRYASCRYPIRDDLAACHRDVWQRIGAPGTWWTGPERVAIAAEARRARSCALCAERKAALSPFAVEGVHDGEGRLPAPVVDTIHRIVTDPGRLTQTWYKRVVSEGLPDTHYVELVGVTVAITALDVFARAVGADLVPLPEPRPGEPSRVRPEAAGDGGAWVPLIPPGEAGGEEARDLYPDMPLVPFIGRALSLVPAEVRGLAALSGPHYMSLDHVPDPTFAPPDRALDRLQMELVAARISALNECFY